MDSGTVLWLAWRAYCNNVNIIVNIMDTLWREIFMMPDIWRSIRERTELLNIDPRKRLINRKIKFVVLYPIYSKIVSLQCHGTP